MAIRKEDIYLCDSFLGNNPLEVSVTPQLNGVGEIKIRRGNREIYFYTDEWKQILEGIEKSLEDSKHYRETNRSSYHCAGAGWVRPIEVYYDHPGVIMLRGCTGWISFKIKAWSEIKTTIEKVLGKISN